jgi:hypothetical protein
VGDGIDGDGGVGNVTEIELPMNNRTNLFVQARMSETYSFYLISPPLSQGVCAPDMVAFSVETGGNTNLTFQWTFNGVPIAGATNSSYTIDQTSGGEEGYYACIISDGTNSIFTSAAHLGFPGWTQEPNYIAVVSDRQDYTFRSGITYDIWQPIQLHGKTTIEAGAILKFDPNSDSTLIIDGNLVCKGEPYYPAILTSAYDGSVGLQLWLYDPEPMNNGVPYLDLSNAKSSSISNLRMSYADWGVTTPVASRRLDVWNCQFVQCNYGIVNLVEGTGAMDSLHNVLFAGCWAAVGAATNSIAIEAEQVTADAGDFCLASSTPSRISLTNSIVWGNPVNAAALSTVNVALNPDPTNFQASGAGRYYLTANSPLHGAGTPGISLRLQNQLQGKTTDAPVNFPAYSTLSGDETLAPQARRYANGAPDLGYYYDALDYTVANRILDGARLTVLPGTAIGYRTEYLAGGNDFTIVGFIVKEGSAVLSLGTPTRPNLFTDVQLVQEQFTQPIAAGFIPACFPTSEYADPPALDFRFCHFYVNYFSYWGEQANHIASGEDTGYGDVWSWNSVMNLNLEDCTLHGGKICIGAPIDYNSTNFLGSGVVRWVNNSFDGVSINLEPTWYAWGYCMTVDLAFTARNNLFRRGHYFHLEPIPASAGNWVLRDNLFDRVNIVQDVDFGRGHQQPLDFSHNGYRPLTANELYWDYFWFYPWGVYNSAQLQSTPTSDGSREVILSNAPSYQAGPFGNFYLPDTTPLYGAGSTNAGALGLAQYTTSTNQIKEGATHQVNIGLHYVVATNFQPSTLNLQPIDTDGDGIPDFMEDANGDGFVGLNETDLTNPMTDGVTNDVYNTVYDNVDLSGNGLVGRVKKALGMNPFCSANPLTLTQVAGNNQNMITFTVPVNYHVLTNASLLSLRINGKYATLGAASPALDGNTLFTWNSTYDSPGQHYLQAELTLNMGVGNTEVVANDDSDDSDNADAPFAAPEMLSAAGSIVPFYSVNMVQFFKNDSVFSSSGAFLDAQLAVQNASYAIDVYDPSTTPPTLLTSITGSTSDGIIQEDWGVTNADGSPFAGDTVQVVFNVTQDAGDAGQAFFNGTQDDPSTNTLTRLHSAEKVGNHDGFDFAYFYTPPTSGLEGTFGKNFGVEGSLWQGMQNAVDTLLTPQTASGGSPNYYVSGFNHYTFEYNPGGRRPGYLGSWDDVINLNGDMLMNRTLLKNMYIHGHGNINIMTTHDKYAPHTPPLKITSEDVARNLGNKQSDVYQVANPYRFVFLDGCRTAKADLWANAFGIFPLETNSAVRPQLGPQAFVGWGGDGRSWTGGYYYGLAGLRWRNDDKSIEMAWSYSQTLKDFYAVWQANEDSLAECIAYASNADQWGQVPFSVPPVREFWIYSSGGGPAGHQFFRFKIKKGAWNNCAVPIYVIGHSGLTRYGRKLQFDGQYVRPW